MNISDTLVIGWTAIGKACNRHPVTLRQKHSDGRLSVTPLRVGAQVAFTPEMVQKLIHDHKAKTPTD